MIVATWLHGHCQSPAEWQTDNQHGFLQPDQPIVVDDVSRGKLSTIDHYQCGISDTVTYIIDEFICCYGQVFTFNFSKSHNFILLLDVIIGQTGSFDQQLPKHPRTRYRFSLKMYWIICFVQFGYSNITSRITVLILCILNDNESWLTISLANQTYLFWILTINRTYSKV